MHELVGAIHLHSVYSDGSGTLREMTAAAARAGLDFVILTDHDTRRAADEDRWQGYRDGVLLVVGVEVSCQDRTHVVALGPADAIGLRFKPLRRVLFDLTRQGAAPFVAHAHPAQIMGISLKGGALHEWEIPGFIGVELWSLMHDICDRLTPWRVPSFLNHWPDRISGPHPDTVAQWDTITQHRRFVAIGTLDNHALALPVLGRRLLPYEDTFRALATHVLSEPMTGRPDDADRVIQALRAGRCFLALDRTADARGFRFTGEPEGGGPALVMGEEMTWPGPVRLTVRSPHPARLVLRRNGAVAAEAEANTLGHRATEPGVYRAEAHLQGLPWVYTNPIYLWPEGSSAIPPRKECRR